MKHYWFTPLALLLSLACSSKEPVVARIGKERITLEEFKTAYLEVIKQPNVFDSHDLREQFLDELIDRRLLAHEARQLGMAGDERLQYRVAALHDKALRDLHFQQVIKPKINISETDLERTYAWMNEERRISHLFCASKPAADSLYALLQQGAEWNTLALRTFDDLRLAQSGGDLGWVAWEQMEYDLANVAFALPLNTPSQPAASSYGWHILKVTDWRKTPLLTEAQYQLQRRNARTLLEQKLGDKAALAYVGSLMRDKKIRVYPGALRAVGERLGVILKRQPSTADQLRPEQLNEAEMGQIESSLWQQRREPLASLDGEILTIGEFIAALNYVPYHAAHRSLKTALDYVLRDRALTREAREMGLERAPQVRLRTALFEQNHLQMARRRSLLAEVRVDSTDLQRYLAEHFGRNPELNTREAADLTRRDALMAKRTVTLQSHLQQLRGQVRIEKNSAPIHAWYDAVVKQQ